MAPSEVTPDRTGPLRRGDRALLPAGRLDDLVQALRARGFEVRAPVQKDGALMPEPIEGASALPVGLGDEQSPGRYRLAPRGDGAFFGHALGPKSWRHDLHPQRQKLLESRPGKKGAFTVLAEPPVERRLALLGVRPCDLEAIAVQDRVLAHGAVADPHYVAAKKGLFVVAVHCAEPGGTCFCASMGTGPRARGGFDLALTELLDGGHRFVVDVGSEAGAQLAGALALAPAPEADLVAAAAVSARAATRMGRTLDAEGVAPLLARSARSPRWEQVASRCLSCTSCTLVCPTCYCTNVVDRTDLAGEVAIRWRRWDSCHTRRHSYIHGGSVRQSTAGRYRHWLTHKLSTWKAQFGVLGCVGCGRCITWCPAGIDLTAEVRAIRELEEMGEVRA
ncbi:MAG TPA: 4Fe-4S dicluster domain-containing protein [Anaeromyxobacteraceae bacterium]|nr:4Fe-4S dicluster domain-containing protein [Anaeromyxobacteraceae bacterium]